MRFFFRSKPSPSKVKSEDGVYWRVEFPNGSTTSWLPTLKEAEEIKNLRGGFIHRNPERRKRLP